MILYRLAKWMEERKRLKHLIAEADGDCTLYIEQKARVERQMLQEAYMWFDPGKTPAAPVSSFYMLDELGIRRPVASVDESVLRAELDLREMLESVRSTAVKSGERVVSVSRNNEPLHVEDLIPEELLHRPLLMEEALHPQL